MSNQLAKKNHTFIRIVLLLLSVFYLNQLSAQDNGITLKAKVVDESGDPLVGVTVMAKALSIGTTTDSKGDFSLKLPSKTSIVLTYIGYKKLELTFAAANGKVISMTPDSKLMDELVVVGYGAQRKIDISGAVSSVSADVAKDRVVQNIGDALKGKVAGVVVTATDGEPGATNSISIRGNTSLSSDSEPLYIIDGVISDASDVVPSQIASIDILKDAASTAIYGSRGANGVILITTNQGSKNTKTKVDFYALFGSQQLTKFLPMLNGQQYADFRYLSNINTAGTQFDVVNSGQPWGDTDTGAMLLMDNEGHLWAVSRNAFYNQYYFHEANIPANTDWQKEIYRVAPIQDYRLTISGGSAKSSFSLMLGSKNQQGIQIASGYQNYSYRLNMKQDITNNASFGINSSLQYTTTDLPKGINVLSLPPFLGVNSLRVQLPTDLSVPTVIQNPLFYANMITNTNRELVATNTANLSWEIIKGLRLYLSGTYINRQFANESFYPGNVAQGSGNFKNGIATLTQRWTQELSTENFLQYTKKINEHNFNFMLGNSASNRTYKTSVEQNSNFTLQDLGIWNMNEGLSPSTPLYNFIGVNNLSFFGRLEYNYNDKYIFKTSLRADGSSVFAKDNKWGYFPSVAGAWRINQEKFMSSFKNITNLKLRMSYGVSGKQAIAPYQSLSVAQLSKLSVDGVTNSSSLLFTRLGNDQLKWESTREFDLGLDLNLFRDRLGFVIDVYDKKTSNLLYNNPLPYYTGFVSQTTNIGEVQNRGIEFSVNASPFQSNNGFNWDINFNISKNASKVLSLGEQTFQMIGTGWGSDPAAVQGILQVGQPLGNWYGYKTQGIWQSYAEINQAIANGTLAPGTVVNPGYIKYQDISGPNGVPDGKITADDRQILGNGFPDFTGGLTNSFTYKGISLNITLQFSYGQKVFNATAWGIDGVTASSSGGNYSTTVLQSFRPDLYSFDPVTGQKGTLFLSGISSNRYPTFMAQRINNTDQIPLDWYIQDASFLRVADVTLSYSFDKKILAKLKLSNIKLFLTATNLWVFTNYNGYDPEVNTSQGQSSYLLPGLDNQAYPKPRILSAGLNVTF